jgi:hypothetical protein
MTDPTIPNHDQPVEGSRSESYTGPDAGDLGGSADTSDAGAGAQSKATDVLESLRETIEELAVKAGPVVRQVSAKAAEVVATAADKAVPLAHKAGEVTADASGKLAEKSRSWAAEVRESLSDNGSADKTDKTEPPTSL